MDLFKFLGSDLAVQLPLLEVKTVELACVGELPEVVVRHAEGNFETRDARVSIEDRNEVAQNGAVFGV